MRFATQSLPESGEAGWARERAAMVVSQIQARGIDDAHVLGTMHAVPRHRFVPSDLTHSAYEDRPLEIGFGQTISQPYIVALMTSGLRLAPSARVLEVGTGCGYQTAILALLATQVFTVELEAPLLAAARARVGELGIDNIHWRCGDGTGGWPEAAPFDAILVAAATPIVPPALLAQLAEGGRLVLPLGDDDVQELTCFERRSGDFLREELGRVRFVPLRGALRNEGD